MYARNPILNLLIWIFTLGGTFGKKFRHSNNLLTNTQTEIINAVADREKLKTELEQLKLQLTNERQAQLLSMNKERATWDLQRMTEKSNFDLEVTQMRSKEKFEVEQAVKRAELKSEETLVLKKLDFEQKIRQLDLDKEKSVLLIKEEYAKKESKMHEELHATMYDKLNKALITMSQEGDKNTQFVHKLMLNIFDKAPGLNTFQNINRNYTGTESLPAANRTEVEVSQV